MRKATFAVVVFLAALCFATPSRAIVVAGPDPNGSMYSASGGGAFDGVAQLFLTFGSSTFGCSGGLLSTGRHVVTAGHCVADSFGAALPGSSSVRFITESGTTNIAGASYIVNPAWDGDLFSGTDLAIITLAALAPADATRYDIYRNTDEVGQIGTLAGFGLGGTGATGPTAAYPFGTRRKGMNQFDALGSFFDVSGAILLFDFDNGLEANDALRVAGLPDLGLGLSEVNIASGDSGGPTFLDGKIAGVHSFGARLIVKDVACPPDVETPANLKGAAGCKLDFSFGELGGDMRVSSFQTFIDAALVPEPGSILLMSSGLAGLLSFLRRSRK